MNRTRLAAAPLLAALALAAGAPALAQSPANPAPAAVHAGTYQVEPAHTRITWSVSHMGFTTWFGDFTTASGSLTLDPRRPTAARLDVSVPTASVVTTNARLDGELRSADWFDAARFPTTRFVSTAVRPTGPGKADVTGDLTFHGVTRPVTLHVSFNAAGPNPMTKRYTAGFEATGRLKRSDFGVAKYVPLVGDEVTLRISAGFEQAGG